MRTLRSRLAGLVIVSLAAVVALPLFNAFYLSPSFSRLIIEGARMEAERTAAHLAESFFDASGLIRAAQITPELRARIARDLRILNLEKLKAFAPSGEIVFSSDPAEEGMVNTKPYFREVVATGRTHTEVVHRDGRTAEGRAEQFDVVETYVPVMRGGRFAGAFEVYYDITARTAAMNSFLGRANLIAALMAAIFLVVLVVVALRALRTARECERDREQLRERSDRPR